MYKAVKVNPGIRSGGVNRLGLGLGSRSGLPGEGARLVSEDGREIRRMVVVVVAEMGNSSQVAITSQPAGEREGEARAIGGRDAMQRRKQKTEDNARQR
jgi:hypothetical protein